MMSQLESSNMNSYVFLFVINTVRCCLYKTAYSETRRPLSNGIISATRLLQKKYGEGEDRSHDLMAEKQKNASTSQGSSPGPTT